MYEIINNILLQVKEYKGQRVVTFRDIDTIHQRPEGTAKRNFNKHRKYFIEGIDFFKVCADEIRTHKIIDLSPKAHEDIILLTESGYLMVVKSLTDDLAWNIQRQLVNSYFKVQQIQANGVPALTQYIKGMEQRQNELERRIEMLESKSSLRLPVKNSLHKQQANALYIMEKLEQDGGTVFHKRQVLRLCQKLKTRQVTEILKLLADNGYISYRKERHAQGRPSEIIEIIKK